MDEKPFEFKKNKRLIEKESGEKSHVGGGLTASSIDDVKLNKRGMSIFD